MTAIFKLNNRTAMKLLFDKGIVTEMIGTYKEGFHERRWEVRYRPVNLFRDESYYEAAVSGIYETFTGATLDEALDKLQAAVEEEKAIKAEAVKKAVTV